ncbi:hypothetical protein ACF053_04630 [Streptomyces kanasensis]
MQPSCASTRAAIWLGAIMPAVLGLAGVTGDELLVLRVVTGPC